MSRILDFSDGFTSATEPTTGDSTISGDLVVTGDLTVGGTTTTLNTQTLDVEDLNITVNNGGNDASADGAGLTVERTSTNGSLVYDSIKTSKWKLGNVGSEVEVVTVSGSQTLTNKSLTSPAITTPTGIVKGDVGLGNVDNTSDATKNSASATLTNKTLTSPVLTTPSFDILTATEQGSTPSSPSAGTRKIYVKDDGKAYLLNSSGTETALGSGGAGGINYLSSNPDAETSTTGWATYADAAASSPVDGTGGSPSSTYTRSTSSPLRGQASFLWTKSAANRQGEGFSYAFTIDASDKAKVLQISFDYLVSSGTYANSDMTIWIYDVTNAALIQPAGYTIQNATVSMSQKATFQAASNSTSYRLIVHTASTSALAYTLQFDNFAVGPQIVTNGAAVTDWTSWTPTGSWSTNTTYSGAWKMVGDSANYHIRISLAGAPTSATLTVNLPSGHVIDTTKTSSTAAATFSDSSVEVVAAGSGYFGQVGYSSTTAVQILVTQGASNANNITLVTQAVPGTFANGDYVDINFVAPISGWSSNVQLSSDTDTRVVAMRVQAATPTGSTSAGSAVIYGTAAVFDTHAGYSTSTGQYTVPVSGYYQVYGQVSITGTEASNQYIDAYVYKNTTLQQGCRNRLQNSGTDDNSGWITALVSANAGDTLEIRMNTNITGAAFNSNVNLNFFQVQRVSGPAVVAASEAVNCKYTNTAGTSVANTGVTLIPFDTKAFDSHNAVTTGGSWKFTAPVSGVYQVAVSAIFDGTLYAIGNTIYGLIYKNGANDSTVAFQNITAAQSPYITVAGVSSIRLLAGDYVSFYLSNSRTAGATTLNTAAQSNYICITRIGNY